MRMVACYFVADASLVVVAVVVVVDADVVGVLIVVDDVDAGMQRLLPGRQQLALGGRDDSCTSCANASVLLQD